MKRQKRILAGAAAMLLALGMFISCNTPANSGSSDGGSTGGSITLPEGNPEAESKLVGTWKIQTSDYTMTLKADKTWTENSSDSGVWKTSERTWSATQRELTLMTKCIPVSSLDKDFVVSAESDTIPAGNDMFYTRISGTKGQLEGVWQIRFEEDDFVEILEIGSSSFVMTDKTLSSGTVFLKITGTRKENTLSPTERTTILTESYELNDTLTFGGDIYTKQQ